MIFKNFEADLNAAVNEVLAKHGMNKTQLDLRKYRGNDQKVRLMSIDLESAATVPAFTVSRSTVKSGSTSLLMAVERFGIASTSNSKGDTLIEYRERSPSYPFVYQSARGARWKISPAQAKTRFGVA